MKNESEYIQKLREWQTKQYQPGAFLGGDLPPMYYSRSKALGYFLLISGVLFLVGGIVGTYVQENAFEKILGILPCAIGVLQIVGGVRILHKR